MIHLFTVWAGLLATGGAVFRKGAKAEGDCDVVRLFREAGAIPLVVTNTSEMCLWWETYNKLHGKTKNPYDTTRTPGGSSVWEIVQHAVYSPELAPFHVVISETPQAIKVEDVQKCFDDYFASKLTYSYREDIHHKPDKWQKSIDCNGEYFDC
ncbi:fatty-acid amide hydrolase 2 [Trichonephila inaurata madagascariensis]|uniref:Fatty-acid amide hydrolase 2 n=1 Tax=Trichonephila inaurata madagascariensis TaxID=2747483 RepID=A0A8X6YRF3_9ARAC|nr:fatty-acid amide hydrolase 2 [Trichonephila inaurata madagascariensis]